MYDIGDRVKISEDDKWGWVYNVYKDMVYSNTQYYHVVWNEEELYKQWPNGAVRTLFWDTDIVSPKSRMLKNGNRLILSL
jgi:hypothetical protein